MLQPAFRWAGLGAAVILLGLAGAPRPASAQETAWLGVYTQNIDDELRQGLDYKGAGILVTRVVGDSPAARAGVRKGDIIVTLNDRSIDSSSELSTEVRSSRPGQKIALAVYRDGARKTLSVTLGTRPDDDDLDGPEPPEPPLPPRVHREVMELPEGSWTFTGMGRGRLGVRIETLNTDLAEALGAKAGGVLVVEVLDDTPAEKAGLKAGDVIVKVGDRQIDDASELTSVLRARDAGPVPITVSRRGATRTLTATLEESHAMRFERGPMSWRSAPRARTRPDADSQRELQDQIKQLREDMKKLQDQMGDREHN